jgi:hypothetical protein
MALITLIQQIDRFNGIISSEDLVQILLEDSKNESVLVEDLIYIHQEPVSVTDTHPTDGLSKESIHPACIKIRKRVYDTELLKPHSDRVIGIVTGGIFEVGIIQIIE